MDIIVKDVVKYIGESAVLNHVSLKMHGGRVYGFQGINGCGKTMLMRAISGLIHPTAGEVLVDGKPLRGQNGFPENMGLLIENPKFLEGYSGLENLCFLAGIRGKIREDGVKRAMLRAGLNPEEPKKFRKYSLGMKQRLGIACAIMEEPDLILLDEPFISLDEDGIAAVQTIIREEKERGAVIVLACHDYELLSEEADEIFRLTAGTVTRHLKKDGDGIFREAVL